MSCKGCKELEKLRLDVHGKKREVFDILTSITVFCLMVFSVFFLWFGILAGDGYLMLSAGLLMMFSMVFGTFNEVLATRRILDYLIKRGNK